MSKIGIIGFGRFGKILADMLSVKNEIFIMYRISSLGREITIFFIYIKTEKETV